MLCLAEMTANESIMEEVFLEQQQQKKAPFKILLLFFHWGCQMIRPSLGWIH